MEQNYYDCISTNHSCGQQKLGSSLRSETTKEMNATISLPHKAIPQPTYTPQIFTLPVEFYPRLEVQNSKLAKELGHLVQWDGTTTSQITKPPIPKFFPYNPSCVRAPMEAPIEQSGLAVFSQLSEMVVGFFAAAWSFVSDG
jgi:hypothetical protein